MNQPMKRQCFLQLRDQEKAIEKWTKLKSRCMVQVVKTMEVKAVDVYCAQVVHPLGTVFVMSGCLLLPRHRLVLGVVVHQVSNDSMMV